MKRIVIDARESGTTTGRYLDKLVEYLHKLPTEHEFILLVKEGRVSFYKQIAPRFKTIVTPYKEFTFGEQLGFKKQVTSLHADLVFFPMVQQPVWYKGKVVTCMQDLTTIRFRNPSKNWLAFTIKREVYKWVNKKVAKKSLHLITPTDFVKQDVANYCKVNPKKITVTYESADKITVPAEPIKKLVGKKFLLAVGRPAANKNLPRLIDAYAILKRDNPDLSLVFAGKFNSEYEKLQAYAQSKAADIVFTDFVSEGELRWLYENAKVYVFPSMSEGFGLPGLEAMQYNLPVAASNATCLPEVYKNAAQYFNPFSASHMAAKIQQLLDNKQLATKLTNNGQALLKTYSWQRMAKQTLAVFDAALGKK